MPKHGGERGGRRSMAHLERVAPEIAPCPFSVFNRKNPRVRRVLSLALALAFVAPSARAEPTAEVLHWWTSGGEAKALKVIADRFTQSGGRWVAHPLAGA